VSCMYPVVGQMAVMEGLEGLCTHVGVMRIKTLPIWEGYAELSQGAEQTELGGKRGELAGKLRMWMSPRGH